MLLRLSRPGIACVNITKQHLPSESVKKVQHFFGRLHQCLFAITLLLFSASSFAGTFPVYGPEQTIRESGSPDTVTSTFTVAQPGIYTLQIQNGGLEDADLEPVSSSTITLNGTDIVGPNDFNQQVTTIEKQVNLLSNNTLSVLLKGKPGGAILLSIMGEDSIPPTITANLSAPPNANGWHNTDVTVTFDCNDDFSGIATCSDPVVVSAEGENQVISGTATDNAGNIESTSVFINMDKTGPVISLSSPSDGDTTENNSVDVIGSITDNSIITTTQINGAPLALNGAGLFGESLLLQEGTNNIQITAIDIAGNNSVSDLSVAYVPANGISLAITSPMDGEVVSNNRILVNGTISGPGNVGVSVNGQPAQIIGNNFYVNNVVLDEGLNTLNVQAESPGGDPVSETLIVTSSGSGAMTIEAAPTTGVSTLNVTFTVTNYTDAAIQSINLDVDGDNVNDITTSNGEPITYEYTSPGIYNASMTVTDINGVEYLGNYVIVVRSLTEVDLYLQELWNSVKSQLASGNIEQALLYFTPSQRQKYQEIFNNISAELPQMFSNFPSIAPMELTSEYAEYLVILDQNGENNGYFIDFMLQPNGVWYVVGM